MDAKMGLLGTSNLALYFFFILLDSLLRGQLWVP